ncbi:hypothetical protein EV182_008165 [Spiromyces aspiralis]|uniref:Uncharacterized protein n=1 Tax=Spiromyces aspiralis TaxID=68401 RepID=A0ACC1HIV2_9FUNG|nr:hypothetical protein EV182_008165 [Spiromyces aspiralis]
MPIYSVTIEVSLPDIALADLDRLPSYYELFEIIEAKHSISEEDRAFEQLLFTWGIVVCGSNIRVCLLGPNKAMFALKVIDITTRLGREAFIEFLINYSFCDTDQLGLDLTMDYLEDIKCWKAKS